MVENIVFGIIALIVFGLGFYLGRETSPNRNPKESGADAPKGQEQPSQDTETKAPDPASAVQNGNHAQVRAPASQASPRTRFLSFFRTEPEEEPMFAIVPNRVVNPGKVPDGAYYVADGVSNRAVEHVPGWNPEGHVTIVVLPSGDIAVARFDRPMTSYYGFTPDFRENAVPITAPSDLPMRPLPPMRQAAPPAPAVRERA